MAGARSRVSRVLMTGPLAPFAEAYGLELKKRGYTRLTTVNERPGVCKSCAQVLGWAFTEG